MDEITLFHYKDRKTFFHRLNPSLKILIMLFFSSMIILYNYRGLSYLSFFIILLVYNSKINFKEIIIQSRFFLIFMICIFLAFSFSENGKTLFSFYFIKISLTGILTGLLQCWKFCLFILCGIFFTSTTDPSSFKKAVFFILKPIPIVNHRRFASISGMSLILLPKVLDNYKATMDALKSRGFTENRNIYRKIKILSSAVITSNLLNIKNIADAYTSRSYNEETINYKLQISAGEVLIFIIFLLLLIPSFYFNYIF